MKKFIIIILCLFLSGCSFLPKILAPASTVPQETVKSQKTEICTGDYKVDSEGNTICTKGYRTTEQNFSQKERTMTFKEKIVAWINQFFGWFILITIVLVIFFPGLLYSILSNIINKYKKAIDQTVLGIEKAKSGVELKTALGLEQDGDVQEIIKKIKAELGLK